MESFNQFNKSENKKVLSNYYKVIRKTNYHLRYKLETNIVAYYKIFNNLFNNDNINLDHYRIILLITISFLKLTNGDNRDIIIIEREIMDNDIQDISIKSYNILKYIFGILLIKTKSPRNVDILFNNRDYLYNIKDYIISYNVDVYTFNSLHYIDYVDILREI